MNVILLLFLFSQYLKVGILLASSWGVRHEKERQENFCGDSSLLASEAVAE